jgi:DNA adenine methylase
MILNRLGNKDRIANDIIKQFPQHRVYIEPFFGAGGIFFNKRKSTFNMVNDLDSDVFNLYNVVINQKEELKKAFYLMPIHSDLLQYWKQNLETDPIKKAIRFLLISNFTTNGTGSKIRQTLRNNLKIDFNNMLDKTYVIINDVKFFNVDFRKFINGIEYNQFRPNEKKETFIYCDPPYLKTSDNYSHSFKETDSTDLFDCLQATGCNFAISEFDNDFILNQAKERSLNVIIIGERQSLKNRRIEILVTNYENTQKSLFD